MPVSPGMPVLPAMPCKPGGPFGPTGPGGPCTNTYAITVIVNVHAYCHV